MSGDDVKRLYALGDANWYDTFKDWWNRLVSSKAEDELSAFLRDNLDENKTILELGCGTALNLEKIYSLDLRFKRYLGLDFSPDMLKIARARFKDNPRVEFREKDITRLDDIVETFDIIICTWVLSHLHSPSSVVNRAQKLLSKDGRMFLIFFTTPRWYVNFWLFPFARWLFRVNYLTKREVQKFQNVKRMHNYSANMATTAQIYVE